MSELSIKKKWYVLIRFLLILFLSIVYSQEVEASERKTYDISEGDVIIEKSGDYNLLGSTSEFKLSIKSGAKVNLWIQDLSIETWTYYDEFPAPINVEKGAVLNLIVHGNNTITNKGYGDAITVDQGGKFAISKYSSGSLTANGSAFGSGIGGQGDVTINGAILVANGGSYGAGFGNSLEPNNMTLKINGGTVTAQGGHTSIPAGSDEINYQASKFKDPKVCDVSVASFVITGGNIFVNTSFKEPVNPAGERLYRYLLNCAKGKVLSITMNGKDYGAKQITSKGYLSLWGKMSSDIVIKFTNGKETKISEAYPGIISNDIGNGMTLDLGVSSIDVYEYGFIYKNHIYRTYRWDSHGIKVIGTSNKNYIKVHEGEHIIDFDDVTVDYTNQSQSFMTIASHAQVTINFSGVNQITTNQGNHAFLLGYIGSLSFTSNDESNVMKLINTNGYGSIFTANGTMNQYGGTIISKSLEAGYGIVLGDSGAYHLYGGRYQASSEAAQSIFGLCQMKVYVHGGELIADTIGYRDEGNEEILDQSTFIATGGTVMISQRLIFGKVLIYGGNTKVHLLGSGSGTQLYQFAGDLVMDKFITYIDGEPPYRYIIDGKVNKESAINIKNLYGGSIQESNEVSVEELQKISIGRC